MAFVEGAMVGEKVVQSLVMGEVSWIRRHPRTAAVIAGAVVCLAAGAILMRSHEEHRVQEAKIKAASAQDHTDGAVITQKAEEASHARESGLAAYARAIHAADAPRSVQAKAAPHADEPLTPDLVARLRRDDDGLCKSRPAICESPAPGAPGSAQNP